MAMKFKRLADQELRGKRVFIRADLNVPQDETGNITDDTRIRASVPGIRLALDKGAAVMVTSHLGRPKEGRFDAKDSLAPIGRRLGELLGIRGPIAANWIDGVAVQARGSRAARELPLQRRREGGRRSALEEDRGALRRLRQRRFRHRAPRGGDDARRGAIRQDRLRRPADGRGARRARHGARASRAPAGGDRRRLQGVDQAPAPRRARRRRWTG